MMPGCHMAALWHQPLDSKHGLQGSCKEAVPCRSVRYVAAPVHSNPAGGSSHFVPHAMSLIDMALSPLQVTLYK
jgi:hypothetical protein